jgi:peptidyl-prolyl cis-trans isomerase D
MMSGAAKLGYEPKISGAAFNPSNKGKVVGEALTGAQGVYVIRVDDVTTTPIANANVADQKKNMYMQMKQYVENSRAPGYPINILQKTATIADKREQHY